MVRSLPIIFNQTEYLQRLGTGGNTIASSGCYLSSFATLAKACGKDITPVHLNTLFIQGNQYTNGDLLEDNDLTKIFPDIVYKETLPYETIPADLDKLRALMSVPSTWVILEIDEGGGHRHFVLCAGINGVVSIADPMSGGIIDFSTKYGDPVTNILKYVVYQGTPATMETVADDSIRVDRDINWNCFTEPLAHMGIQADPNDKKGSVQKAIEAIDSYSQEIAQLKTERDEYKKKYDTEYTTVLSYQKTIAEDQDYNTKAYDATKLAEQRAKDIHMIANASGVTGTYATDEDLVDAIIKHVVENPQEQLPLSPAEEAVKVIVDRVLAQDINAWLVAQGMKPIAEGQAYEYVADAIDKFLSHQGDEVARLYSALTPEQQAAFQQVAQAVMKEVKKGFLFTVFVQPLVKLHILCLK